MKDVEIIGLLKTYVAKSLVGMGALKGANCRIKSITKVNGISTLTFIWTDTDGNDQESVMLVADGVSPSITVKTSTNDTYILTITDENGSFDTPNLKGSALSDLTDVDLDNLASGDALVYDGSKWSNVTLADIATSGDSADAFYDGTTSGLDATNVQAAIDEVVASLGTAASKDSTDQVTENSHDLIESGAVFAATDNVSETAYSAIAALLS